MAPQLFCCFAPRARPRQEDGRPNAGGAEERRVVLHTPKATSTSTEAHDYVSNSCVEPRPAGAVYSGLTGSSDANGPIVRSLRTPTASEDDLLIHLQGALMALEASWFEKVFMAARTAQHASGAAFCTVYVLDDEAHQFTALATAGPDPLPSYQHSGAQLPALRGPAPTDEPRNSLQIMQAMQAPFVLPRPMLAAAPGHAAALPPDCVAAKAELGVTHFAVIPLRRGGGAIGGALTLGLCAPSSQEQYPAQPASASDTLSYKALAPSVLCGVPAAPRLLFEDASVISGLGAIMSMVVFGSGQEVAAKTASLLSEIAAAASLQQLVLLVTAGVEELMQVSTKLSVACNVAIVPLAASRAIFFEATGGATQHSRLRRGLSGLMLDTSGSTHSVNFSRGLNISPAVAGAAEGPPSVDASSIKLAVSRLQRSNSTWEEGHACAGQAGVRANASGMVSGSGSMTALPSALGLWETAQARARGLQLKGTLLSGVPQQGSVFADLQLYLQQLSAPKKDLYLLCANPHAAPQSLALAVAPLGPLPPSAPPAGPVTSLISHAQLPSIEFARRTATPPSAASSRGPGGDATAASVSCINATITSQAQAAATVRLSPLGPSSPTGPRGQQQQQQSAQQQAQGQLALYLSTTSKLPQDLLASMQVQAQQLLNRLIAPAVSRRLSEAGPVADEWATLLDGMAGGPGSSAGDNIGSTGNLTLLPRVRSCTTTSARTLHTSGKPAEVSRAGSSSQAMDFVAAAAAVSLVAKRSGLLSADASPRVSGTAAAADAALHGMASMTLASAATATTRNHMAMLVSSFKETLNLMQMNRDSSGNTDDLTVLSLGSVLGRGGSGLVVQGKLYSALEVAIKLFENPDDADAPEAAGGSAKGSSDDTAAAGATNAGAEAQSKQEAQQTKRHRDLLRNALELAAMTSLSHPNIVQGFCHWVNVVLMQDSGRKHCWLLSQEDYAASAAAEAAQPPLCSVLVMEYCDAGTLLHAIARGTFKLSASASLVAGTPYNLEALYMTLLEVALALRHLHGANLAHCDIKPGNILLRSSPRDPRGFNCKLGDFGYVAILKPDPADGGRATTMPQDACGTLQYMAPENFVSGRLVDASIDVYSFGLLMWELTSGKPPFHDADSSSRQLMKAVYQGKRPTFDSQVPQPYRQLAASCWAGDPAKRPTAASVVKILRQRLEGCTKQQARAPLPLARSTGGGAGAGAGGHRAPTPPTAADKHV